MVQRETGQPLAVWQDLMDRMKAAEFGVIFFGMGLTMTRGKHANSEALLALTRDMNKYTRFVCKPNRGHGNVTGADNVVSWRTGYPFGVNLGRGYPRFNPGEYTAVGRAGPPRSRCGLDHRQRPDGQFQSAGARASGVDSLHRARSQRDADHAAADRRLSLWPPTASTSPGTVYRMDDVPIPLRPAFESPLPSDFDILSALEIRVQELQRRDLPQRP